MNCPQVRAHLLRAEMEALSPEGEIGRHLAGCPGCATQVTNIRIGTAAVADTFNGWSSNLDPNRIVERIGLDQAMARSRSEQWWGLLGTAAIVIVSLLVYLAKSERTAGVRAVLGFPDLPYIASFQVSCIPPEAAVEIALSILGPSRGTAKYSTDGSRSVVLSGSRPRVVAAELAIRTADGTLDPKHPRSCSTPLPDNP